MEEDRTIASHEREPAEMVLVGGGHAHVEVLRRLALEPLDRLRITLVSPDRRTPYSGMLPGWIAGHYSEDDVHIDLAPLCARAGVRMVVGRAAAIDPRQKRLQLSDGQTLDYDLLSLNSGATPATDLIPGAAEHAVAVKPVERFIRWLDSLAAAGGRLRLGVIGAGAAGCEVALALRHRFERAGVGIGLHLFDQTPDVLPGYPARVRLRMRGVLARRSVQLHLGRGIGAVTSSGIEDDAGLVTGLDQVVLATGAMAPAWLRQAGLQLDQRGFVQVGPTLQSVSDPSILAAGDVASFAPRPLPKAGVYAVREGPALAGNLRRLALGQPARIFEPQTRFLSLISLGGKKAIASRGRLVFAGALAWRLKDWIDRRFMERYARL